MAGTEVAEPAATVPAKEQPKKVFVQRDYTMGTECRFDTAYPSQLEEIISRETFADTINKVNELFCRAEELNCPTYTEGCLACMTGYMLYFCIETRYSKEMKQISLFIQKQNDEIYHPQGVHLIEPMLRGLRCIEVIVYPRKHNGARH